MKGKTLKYIILLATISVAGILLIQFIFLRYSYNYSEKQFRESTTIALKEVAWQILQQTGNTLNYDSITPVEIVSDNYYRIYIQVYDREQLKQQLTEELKKHEIYSEFEFAIFNPDSEQMGEGTLVSHDAEDRQSLYNFPLSDKCIDYFAIHFPSRVADFNARLSLWYLLTGLLLLVIIFFGYTLSVIIRQRQLSEIQKNFINNLTHELKTPISSIALSAGVINNESILNTPKRLFKYAKIIQEQNTRLSKNVEKVLNLASLEKNKIKLNLETFEIHDFLEKNIEEFEQSDFGRKTEVRLDLKVDKKEINADKFHFSNLILNILENAAKYCDQQPQITIQLLNNRNKLILNFADNGIGIPKEHRKRIFKKFYRVPTGNVHNVKGFGLGLDYVAKIAKAHGWKIKVDNNPTGGSIFTLTIPIKK